MGEFGNNMFLKDPRLYNLGRLHRNILYFIVNKGPR